LRVGVRLRQSTARSGAWPTRWPPERMSPLRRSTSGAPRQPLSGLRSRLSGRGRRRRSTGRRGSRPAARWAATGRPLRCSTRPLRAWAVRCSGASASSASRCGATATAGPSRAWPTSAAWSGARLQSVTRGAASFPRRW